MIKLVKYLKPYVLIMILAVGLLFVQAMADLALPDYMSDIVNVGIQQGGIKSAVPEAIRQTEMDKITAFMTPQEKSMVLDNYKLIDKDSNEYEKYSKNYPNLSLFNVYLLNSRNKDTIEKLNSVMGKALIMSTSTDMMKTGQEDMPDLENIETQIAALGDSMINQIAISIVKMEYKALGMDTDKIQTRYIRNAGLMMLAVALVSAAATVMVGFLASICSSGVARNIRLDLFKKVSDFSNNEFDKFSTASLITRTTNDITQVQMLVFFMIRIVFYAPIMGVGGVIRALRNSPSMSWIITLAVVVLLGLISIAFSIALPKFKIVQKLIDKLNLVMRENLSGIMVIRAFNTQGFEEKRFDKANRNLTKTNLFVNRLMSALFPIMMLLLNGLTLLIVWVGAHEIEKSGMQFGNIMAFLQYVMQIIFSFIMISMMFIMVPRASVSANRIAEVLNTELTIKDPKKPLPFDEGQQGVVEFRNVFFKYPGAEDYVLKDITFKALPGQTTAFIGSTGTGKTTLVNLIPRFYDVTEGQVLVGGVDVRDIAQKDLRDKIGYVPQKSSLFSGTIASNIKYADENIPDEDMIKAAEVAQATKFIEEKPESYQSEIAQGGTNVSGGQKQRLSIARALAKKPDIYIFDDSFSALDFKTDSALRKALKNHASSSTLLIVAQRVSTIKNADQIIVLNEGKIAGIGTHKELMESCPAYQEIAQSQLSKEELAQ